MSGRGPATPESRGTRDRDRRDTGAARRVARRWRKDPAGRRERIAAAATRLLARDGYAGVRTRDIAAAAGVSEGTVYHHFGSKQGVLVAVAERYGRGFASAMFEDVDHGAGLPSIEAVIRRAFAFVRHSDPLFGVFLLTDDPTGSQAARTANREAIVASLREVFESWRSRGMVRAADPRICAELCFGLVEAALKECFVRGRGDEEDAYVAEVVHAIGAMLDPATG